MNLLFDFEEEGYEREVLDDWLCVMPTCEANGDFRGYRIFKPDAPFIAGHPTFVFEGDGFSQVSTLNHLPRFGHRFQVFHAVKHHRRTHSDLVDILKRNLVIGSQNLGIETNHSFFGNLMGLFDHRSKLECILMLEERMEFGIEPCSHSYLIEQNLPTLS